MPLLFRGQRLYLKKISAEKRGAGQQPRLPRQKATGGPAMGESWGRTGFDGDEEAENRGPRRRWPRKKRQQK